MSDESVVLHRETIEPEEEHFFRVEISTKYSSKGEVYTHVVGVRVVDLELSGRVVVEGDIKWDGCMNVLFYPPNYTHFCGPNDVDRLAKIVKSLWAIARPFLKDPLFDLSGH